MVEKSNYIKNLGKLLSDESTGQKKYWKALKELINNHKCSSFVPPIFHNNDFVSDFKEKCTLFNDYFKRQCTLITASRNLPPFQYTTESRLNEITITRNAIITLIRNLKPNKAHGHDGLSTQILLMCDDSIALPLKVVLQKVHTWVLFL